LGKLAFGELDWANLHWANLYWAKDHGIVVVYQQLTPPEL